MKSKEIKKQIVKNKGITLIALVVTIIVLLILAGVSINLIMVNDGILGRAENAVTEHTNASIAEEVELAMAELQMQYYEDKYVNGGKYEDGTAIGDFAEYATKKLTKGINTSNGTLKLEDEKVNYYEGTNTTPTATGEFATDKGTVTIAGVTSGGTEGNGGTTNPEPEPELTKYTVTYNANGGNGAPTDSNEYTEGATVTVDFATAPTKEGFTFLGWATTAEATTATYTSSGTTSFTMGTANVTLYAVWEENLTAGATANTSNRALSGSTQVSQMTYKNPVIPQGFNAVNTTEAEWEYIDETKTEVKGWNNGLVIEDAQNQNQFVWVPVDGTNVTYQRWCTLGRSYVYCTDVTDTTTIDGVTYSAMPVDENAQIETYGGFYVARYEAGLATSTIDHSKELNNVYTEVPVSKQGAKIWNYIDYTHSYVAAQKMVNNTTTYGNNKSGLITGTQWDTIMKWYEKAGIKVDTTQDWGTYKNLDYSYSGTQVRSYFTYNGSSSAGSWQKGAFSHTGSTKSVSISNPTHYHASGLNSNEIKKNIADLGGNVREWSSESSSGNRNYRGGHAGFSSTDRPASYREGLYNGDDTEFYIGFRGVLYVAVDAE